MKNQQDIDLPLICKCAHLENEHITVLIKPDGLDGKVTGTMRRCRRCLCQNFEPQEQIKTPDEIIESEWV